MKDELDIFKALANEKRLQILRWLKEPERNFGRQGPHIPGGDDFAGGVCVGSICEKTGMSQSTTSSHLDQMQRSGLLESRRFGKWTYCRRNEETISALVRFVADDLWRTSAFLRKCIDN